MERRERERDMQKPAEGTRRKNIKALRRKAQWVCHPSGTIKATAAY